MRGQRKSFNELPDFAAEFLQTTPAARAVVRQFHIWLKRSYRPIRQLESSEVERFLQQLAIAHGTDHARHRLRRHAFAYLEWLHAHNFLGFDPRCAWPRSNFPLPPHAQRFVESLKPTHQLSTVRTYRTNLRQFHMWMHSVGVSVFGVERRHVESWLQWMHDRGLAACTRVHAIQNIRAYFEWLEDQQVLETPSSTLIRSSDLPKQPQYLPRPVAADLDMQLQQRFKRSRCMYQLGLLLMRRTGLRVGELANLPYRCIRTDHSGNTLLKVPLGKLATERLVPLDPPTIKLVSKLRQQGPRRRQFLLSTSTGRKTRYDLYRTALKKACRGLQFEEPMTTHRLRHTYATSLLAAGMSLPSVMRLLGHSDYRMTLRYAAISDATVVDEFTTALARNADRYPTVIKAPMPTTDADPLSMLTDVVRHLQKRTADDLLDRQKANALVRRVRRIHSDLRKFLRKSTP